MKRLIQVNQTYGRFHVIGFDSKTCPEEEKRRFNFVKCVDMVTGQISWKRADNLKKLGKIFDRTTEERRKIQAYKLEHHLEL